MKKQNENNFINKFRFLHSQESSEEISWSCSDSSDYELNNSECQTLNNITNSVRRKRKRVNRRKKLKNTSNLDITILNTSSEKKSSINNEKSPILVGKSVFGIMHKSPILTPVQLATKITNKKSLNDSAITSYNEKDEKYNLKSPIIHCKTNSPNCPKVSPKVRKKLFESDKCLRRKIKLQSNRSTSPILRNKSNWLETRKYTHTVNEGEVYDRKYSDIENRSKYFKDNQINYNVADTRKEFSDEEIYIESTQSSSSQDSVSKKSHTELVAKVKSYFDSCFTSQESLVSISECETLTPKNSSKSSGEVDIVTPVTQERSVVLLSKDILSTDNFESHIPKKKIKYKKGGLAFRLNALLRKQNSTITLWQHERFLAANSNFVIPKQEFLVFRIKSVCFKYGIYLLEVFNKDDEFYILMINNIYLKNNVFEVDSILKIYEPLKVSNIDSDCKIISNVCKFECEKLIV